MFWCENPLFSALSLDPNFRKFGLDGVLFAKGALIFCMHDRHGTTCLFGNLNVATGEIVAPKFNATRTEEDFAENIDAIVATNPEAGWIFVCDNLNRMFLLRGTFFSL